jgi:predicted alpha/beta superfamily hydrolase
MTVGTTRPRYKFVAHDASATAVWFSDPHSRRFDFDENGRLSIVRGGPLRGHLESLGQVHATKLANDRAVTVWVPPGYEQSTANASVLYMHDGQNLFDADQPDSAPFSWEADEAANAEVLAGHATPFLIVGMANTAGRIDEYTPVTDTYNGQTVGGKGDDYADFVVHDVKPLVDHRFRTFTDRAHTGVVGSSLGGVISYHLGLKFPDVFRFVGGMSSTFDWGAGLNNPLLPAQYRALGSLTTRGQVFYLDSGGGPGPSGTCPADGPNDGNDNYCETLWMKDALLAGGATTFPDDPNAFPLTPANIDLEHWVDPGAPHSETSWRVRVFRPMRLFFRP